MHHAAHYDYLLVAVSIVIAVLASFTALNLAGRLTATRGPSRLWWLAAAAAALGGGIWSMHFVGMLALVMPTPMTFDIDLTLLSLLVAVGVAGTGLALPGSTGPRGLRLAAAGTIVGIGIASMHYVGMAGMVMPGVEISYRTGRVVASVAIAIAASVAAIWLAFNTTGTWQRGLAALLMGVAIAGMHYTGMAAAQFTMVEHAEPSQAGVPAMMLGLAVAGATCYLLILGLTTAYFDRTLARLTGAEARALHESEARHRALIRNSAGIVLIVTAEGMIVYEGSSAAIILGVPSEKIVGRHVGALVGHANIGAMLRLLEEVAAEPGGERSAELKIPHADGSRRDFHLTARNLIDDGAVGGVIVNLHDITDRNRLLRSLQAMSETDLLTGLLNRRGLLAHAEERLETLRAAGRTATLVMLDIDHFKQVNDRYGHAAGDLALVNIAKVCRAETRSTDILGRWGGEELVILLDGTLDDAQQLVERLRHSVEATAITTIKGEVSVTASIGVTSVSPAVEDFETALKRADAALYAAKEAGRNCVRLSA